MPAKVKGSCVICVSPNASKYLELLRQGMNAGQLNAVAAGNQEGWSRPTWYKHIKHADLGDENRIRAGTGGRPDLLPAHLRDKPLEVRQSSNQAFLETVRDIGLAKVSENPRIVTLEQALKAAQILEGRKDKDQNQVKILVGIFTGRAPEVQVIEGEAQEVS